jgi:hypothetical protein
MQVPDAVPQQLQPREMSLRYGKSSHMVDHTLKYPWSPLRSYIHLAVETNYH